MNFEPIIFENDRLSIIDQTRLPNEMVYIELSDLSAVCEAIRSLKTRGAPAIGIVAAYGMYIAAKDIFKKTHSNINDLYEAGKELKKTRPTAVNLFWAVDRILSLINSTKLDHLLDSIKAEAINIHDEDRAACNKIGRLGCPLLAGKKNILTHCNAGILATGGMGTALAPIYEAHNKGQQVHIYVDETRPLGQGARLTCWELAYNNIPCTLITDNMASMLMAKNKVDAIIVGADRIAVNGDVANKIGTYNLAISARFHNIPFYVAAPLSTFDLSINSGNQIPIEERFGQEITDFWNIIDRSKFNVFNPAFDVTPGSLITAIITPKIVIELPDKNKIVNLFN